MNTAALRFFVVSKLLAKNIFRSHRFVLSLYTNITLFKQNETNMITIHKHTDELMKQIFTLILFTFSCTIFAQAVKQHEVKAGETLYSISKTYNVTVADLKAANGLGDSETILTGQKLKIPNKTPDKTVNRQNVVTNNVVTNNVVTNNVSTQTTGTSDDIPTCKQTYIVKKKETLYSISKAFGLTVDELLAVNPNIKKGKIKKGMELCIPYSKAEKEAMQPKEVEEEIVIKEPQPVNVAVIMPFGLNNEKKTKENITMIDFYEGFMLAVSELKKDGVSGKVYVYDEEDIDSVLGLPQMKHLNLIVGAKEQNNIQKLISFTEKNNINLVVPLSSQTALVNNHHNVFQVNQKMESATYNKAFDSFCAMHPYANFIFVNIEDQTDKIDYVVRMKTYLNGENISYYNIDFKEISGITEMLAGGKENIIIPSSSTKTAFERVVKKLEELELAVYDIDFFGYPDWQAFAEKENTLFSKYNCTFFTSFYNNPNSTGTYAFNRRFHSAFGRDQYNTYPRYGMLGYDIANFFVMNMYVEGEDFIKNIENLNSNSLQNPMHFTQKNSWSGYINNALMFVRYNSDGTISVRQL